MLAERQINNKRMPHENAQITSTIIVLDHGLFLSEIQYAVFLSDFK
jgi:hypothetical protein